MQLRTKYLTVCRYVQDIQMNREKSQLFPPLRGTWLPSFNLQVDFGVAVNWLGWRVRVSLRR